MMKYLLDTHVWIWWNAKPAALSPAAVAILTDPAQWDELLLSAISAWEFGNFVATEQLVLSRSVESWLEEALRMQGLRLAPVSPLVALRATMLPGGVLTDIVDQIIVATAREENATIITSDERILNYKHVQSLW